MRKLIKLTAFLLAAVVIIGMIKLPDIARRFIYPTDYSEYISEYPSRKPHNTLFSQLSRQKATLTPMLLPMLVQEDLCSLCPMLTIG